MKKKSYKIWQVIGVIIAIVLLIYWLLAVTVLEEDENVIPVLDGTEQTTFSRDQSSVFRMFTFQCLEIRVSKA